MEIESKQNSEYKELKKIIKSKSSYILIEGKKLFLEAVNSSLKIEKIYLDKENQKLFSKLLPRDKNCEIVFLKNSLLSSLFTTDNKPTSSDLIIALAKRPKWQLKDLFLNKKNIIFLENIQDPGNLGTIIRSALAFNASGIILSSSSVDPFNTKVIRSSAGAVFKVPVVSSDLVDFYDYAKNNNYKLIATSSRAGKNISDLKLEKPYVFSFGNEGRGLSKDLLNKADEVVGIPHSRNIESLNLGVSVSIVLWEAY